MRLPERLLLSPAGVPAAYRRTGAAAGFALGTVRRAIDLVDDGMLLLLATRGRLALAAGLCKRTSRRPPRDPAREARVHRRAQRLARKIGLADDVARAAMALAMADAMRRQGLGAGPADGGAGWADLDQGAPRSGDRTITAMPVTAFSDAPWAPSLLRLLPPPKRLAPLLRSLPPRLRHRLIERACRRVLASPLARGDLEFMGHRRLGVEVIDLGLRWTVERSGDVLRVDDGPADASVRGSATDLLLLAARLEDADTLFFQRRLVLTGDTELGLTVRNLLERLPWESVPLGVRITLNRGARLARAAREAHGGRPA